MATFNAGGPAFPRPASESIASGAPVPAQSGMDLRDWFAGQALAGYFACFAGDGMPIPKPNNAAKAAYEYADAMLAQREMPSQ
jgi:hypothetical protein